MLLKKTKLTTKVQCALKKNMSAKKGGTRPTLQRALSHLRRVSEKKLMETALLENSVSRYVPLAADRTVEFLAGMIARAETTSRRGRFRDEPPVLYLSLLEYQVLQECLKLFQLKVAMQRGDIRGKERER